MPILSLLADAEKLYSDITGESWQSDDVEPLLVCLRSLRTCFNKDATITEYQCSVVLRSLTGLLTNFLRPHAMAILDATDGRDHLVISVTLQCLVNTLSYMAPRNMSFSGEVPASLIAHLVYNEEIQAWVFSLNDQHDYVPLPLWRSRIGCYAFILVSTLLASVQEIGIPLEVTKLCWLSVRCIRRIAMGSLKDHEQLEHDWFNHCLDLVATVFCTPPSATYWEHEGRRRYRVIELAGILGTMLLLEQCDHLKSFEGPSMKKMASVVLCFCLPSMEQYSSSIMQTILEILKVFVLETPFAIKKKGDATQIDSLVRFSLAETCENLRQV